MSETIGRRGELVRCGAGTGMPHVVLILKKGSMTKITNWGGAGCAAWRRPKDITLGAGR